jgi:hypothetical protein
MELYDVVICLGPKDVDIFRKRIANFRQTLLGARYFFCITASSQRALCEELNTHFIDESSFPFSIQEIDRVLGKTGRGGWYLQQLLKLYACECIPGILENFLILDVDVHFHRPIAWFTENKMQLNVGVHIHQPYFQHMKRFAPYLQKSSRLSGICHLMPMKRGIAAAFLRNSEELHKKPCWIAFLEAVEYYHSGASEYELLFEFALTFYQNDCVIRPLKWTNSSTITNGYDGEYEACHHYMRSD